MDSLIDLIRKIEERPTMYIGRTDIYCLKAYLDGWLHRNIEATIDADILDGFQEFLILKYKQKGHSWAQIIAFYSIDNKDEIALFFKNFNEFIRKRAEGPQLAQAFFKNKKNMYTPNVLSVSAAS